MSMDDGTTFPGRRGRSEALTRLINDLMGPDRGPFKPVAFYNRRSDKLTVLTEDVSATEEWVGGELTTLRRNDDDELIGFIIDNARRHICKDLGKSLDEATLEELLRQTVGLKQSKLTVWMEPCLALIRKLESPHVTVT